ncbi:hypothetical protein LCER1_G005806 [Lachnellula cervina]|uniref:Tautomerase cis-CaaD-like domain-containing protein n=1 Tax=Lachnellula cervina TaxID=1316786 RepID=A0A7D8UQI4_9HELO|nr:hypothetical protein LCER1_G005806 [Lachnellula cervina]
MPLWNIKHSPNLLSPSEKQSIAKAATSIYKSIGLPAFYVQVIFTEVPPISLFVGGEAHPKYANIEINHIARSIRGDEDKKRFLDSVDGVFTRLFEDKGASWEYFVGESERGLWKINGVHPPDEGSVLERKWAELNMPVKEGGF